ncbi:hypothetical protein, partial [Streptomyces sp. NPDC007369]|uniref:hypothetical protein n=1 Tax=Streptomyces sp. NPDC007369 TaxID=3154589 RepID=UPI0033EB11FA
HDQGHLRPRDVRDLVRDAEARRPGPDAVPAGPVGAVGPVVSAISAVSAVSAVSGVTTVTAETLRHLRCLFRTPLTRSTASAAGPHLVSDSASEAAYLFVAACGDQGPPRLALPHTLAPLTPGSLRAHDGLVVLGT